MLKKTILTTLLSLAFTVSAGASEDSALKIQALDASGISYSDVSMVSADWAKGNTEHAKMVMSYYHPDVAKTLLEAVPELQENKRVLISLSIGLMLLVEQSDVDIQKTLLNISTHQDLFKKPSLSIKELSIALTSIAA